ncbi:hypothetical protein TWF788_011209 [Orbilia oligospora]|uniref:Peptidase S8/S53 domain-containing protein n=2 Tax=Orbilia oligospora TaxID=2813651 RepID=A0A7C8Q268_ORBOL|nr:hypothetical protein TWF788_011209 [Orbilia oligospora]
MVLLLLLSFLQYQIILGDVRAEQRSFHEDLKVGTTDQITDKYLCFIKKTQRENPHLDRKIRELIGAMIPLAAPRDSTFHWIESPNLGKWAFTMEVVPASSRLYRMEQSTIGGMLISNCNRIKSDLRTIRAGYDGTWGHIEPGKSYERSGEERLAFVKKPKLSSDYKAFFLKLLGLLKMPFSDYTSRILATAPLEVRKTSGLQVDLQVLSQPPGTTADDVGNKFWNFKYAGRGQIVYALDGGFHISHKETRTINIEKMIFPGALPADDGFTAATLTDVDHGTAITAKIAGRTIGIATNATLVLGRVTDGSGVCDYSTLLELYLKVYDDILARGPKQNCIVSLSYLTFIPKPEDPIDTTKNLYHVGVQDESGYSWYHRLAKEALDDVIDYIINLPNTFFVVASGNDAVDVPVNAHPATLGAVYAGVNPRFIVVGGYSPNVGVNLFQTAPYVSVMAPAGSINVPTRWIDKRLEDWDSYVWTKTLFHRKHELGFSIGTSYAGPAVAAMIAAWLSIGIKVKDIVPLMEKLAYPRVLGGPKALYNGVPISRWTKTQVPAWYKAKKSTPLPPAELNIEISEKNDNLAEL